MTVIHKTAVVAYSQAEMYQLVNDIASYSQFVPHCDQSHIIAATEDEIRATLSFAKGGISKSFSTLNRLQPNQMMEIRLLDGPFKQLEGFWRFEPLPDKGSRVVLDLEFEFSNKFLEIMFGSLFNQVANSLVDAFCERAKVVYASDAS